jgi:hypothetical protein
MTKADKITLGTYGFLIIFIVAMLVQPKLFRLRPPRTGALKWDCAYFTNTVADLRLELEKIDDDKYHTIYVMVTNSSGHSIRVTMPASKVFTLDTNNLSTFFLQWTRLSNPVTVFRLDYGQ